MDTSLNYNDIGNKYNWFLRDMTFFYFKGLIQLFGLWFAIYFIIC